jgi:hypothetical protein
MSGTIGTNAGRESGSIGAAATGPTVSGSDPTISSNLTVGTQWINSATGESFICTTATAGSNVWKNIGDGTGGYAPFHFLNCTSYCFAAGGVTPAGYTITIDKNAFASDAPSTDQGDLSVIRKGLSHASSTEHGYSQGGHNGSAQTNIIDKFAMVSAASAEDVGDLTVAGETHAGVTSSDYGHSCGGGAGLARVDRFSFASGTQNAVNLGDLISVSRDYVMGGCSQTHGYIMGSYSGSPTNQIEKFAFSDDVTTANVGNILTTQCAGASHCEDGYVWTSGQFNGPAINQIDKMATASDSNSVDSGSDLSTTCNNTACGNSSKTYGYCMGGSLSGLHNNVVDKWPFNSSSLASDVGNLTVNRNDVLFSGNQL